ncbi:MAG: S-layer family protein [Coleofasciculaceae cyanobacterium]
MKTRNGLQIANDSLLGSVVYARGSRSPSCLKARGSPTPPSEPRFPVVLSDGSFLTARVFGSGTGGNVTIDTERLLVRDGGQVSVSNRGTGNGGDVTIKTQELRILDGASLSASTFGEGNAGNLSVTATEAIEVSGSDPEGNSSSIAAQVGPDATGDGGNLTIETAQLSLSQGGFIAVSTFGTGNGGELTVNATQIDLIGNDPIDGNPSGLFADVNEDATGNGGDVIIETQGLRILDGASLSASTFGKGNAGNLTITAAERIEVRGSDKEGNSSGIDAQVNSGATGNGGDVIIKTQELRILDGASLSASTSGEGNAGNLTVTATEAIEVSGSDPEGNSSSIAAQVNSGATGDGGNLTIETAQLSLSQGGFIAVSTFGTGNGGNLKVNATEIELIGDNPVDGSPSGLFADVDDEATGNGGDIFIETQGLRILDGAILGASTFGEGNAGNLTVNATEAIEVSGSDSEGNSSSIDAQVGPDATGNGGDITVQTRNLLLQDGAFISSASRGDGTAGKLNITVFDTLEANNGTIATSTTKSTGGSLTITAGDIRLWGDSDITTSVFSGAGGGGNIILTADSILAFDDSDILAFARDGQGGDIFLDTPAFFGEDYQPAPKGTDPATLENNAQVDINASGAVSGVITLPDTTFIQNSLTELPNNQIDTESLLANSCIVRRHQPQQGSFTVVGTGSLPQRPGDAHMSSFPTVDIETLPDEEAPSTTNPNRPWQKGDPIVEPTGVYRLPNGKLVLSRECP